MKLYSVLLLLLVSSLSSAQSPDHSQSSSDNSERGSKLPVATSAPQATQSKIDPAKEADIRRLLEVMRASELMTKLMGGMEQGIRPMLTNAFPPGEYREKLISLFLAKLHSNLQSGDLLDLIVPIYDKYYSRDEIKGLIQFYETPVGNKMVSVTPQIAVESQAAGRDWGQQVGADSMREVLSEHPDLEKALEDAKNPTFLPK